MIMFDKRRTLFVLLTSVIMAFSFAFLGCLSRLPFIREDELIIKQRVPRYRVPVSSMCSSL